MTGGLASTGRGGAGNIGSETQIPQSKEPQSTPVIKAETYTTGRGGSGNMARNDKNYPEIARAAQDVEAGAHSTREYVGPVHYGRGGAANVLAPPEEEARKAKERRSSESKDLKERGQALLEKIGLKKTAA